MRRLEETKRHFLVLSWPERKKERNKEEMRRDENAHGRGGRGRESKRLTRKGEGTPTRSLSFVKEVVCGHGQLLPHWRLSVGGPLAAMAVQKEEK